MGKCKSCGWNVDSCQNPECINHLHNTGSIKEGDNIFCNNGNHYCEKDCLVEEFRNFGCEGIETEIVR
jgi:hypothetical protein